MTYKSKKNDSSVIVIDPTPPDQGARRVWSDSQGKIWVSEWNAGKLGMYILKTASGKNGKFQVIIRCHMQYT